MKSLRKIIREYIERIYEEIRVNEAQMSHHIAIERFRQRFLNPGSKRVGYEVGFGSEYVEVGSKKIDPVELEVISNRMDIIEKYRFPRNKSFAIKIYDAYIKPETVRFDSEKAKVDSKGKTLVFVDPETGSNGNVVYVIIRDNVAVTIFFAKSYVLLDAKRFDVDVIVKDFDKIIEKKIKE